MKRPTIERMINGLRDLEDQENETEQETMIYNVIGEPKTAPEDVHDHSPAHRIPQKARGPKRVLKIRIREKAKKNKKRKESEMRRKDRINPGYSDMIRLSRGIMEGNNGPLELSIDDFVDVIARSLQGYDSYQKNIFFNELEKVGLISKDRAVEFCRKKGMTDLSGWLKTQDAWERSKKGDLFDKK